MNLLEAVRRRTVVKDFLNRVMGGTRRVTCTHCTSVITIHTSVGGSGELDMQIDDFLKELLESLRVEESSTDQVVELEIS